MYYDICFDLMIISSNNLYQLWAKGEINLQVLVIYSNANLKCELLIHVNKVLAMTVYCFTGLLVLIGFI